MENEGDAEGIRRRTSKIRNGRSKVMSRLGYDKYKERRLMGQKMGKIQK
ncbi:hypothetical protein A2U01_0091092, partial [Trifolium medium]|nr:hypothetical protein [Trifolium medium]